jgi:hypothetical protein
MKKAKVSAKGVVQRVWPWVKTLPDGSKVIKDIPPHYLAKKFDCIVDVPDRVKVGFVWDGKKYARAAKKPVPLRNDTILAVLCEKLGVSMDDLVAEATARKLKTK